MAATEGAWSVSVPAVELTTAAVLALAFVKYKLVEPSVSPSVSEGTLIAATFPSSF